jgi:uncharacterized protein involved in outer membrane biogenesis
MAHMKKLLIFLTVVALIVVGLSVAKNIIAKTAVSAGVKAMTGLKLSMDSMNVGIIRTLVGITGLKLHNPAGFPGKLMMDMPEIYVDYDLGAFLKKEVHLEEVRLDLKEFVVVKNRDGKLNLDALKVVKDKKSGTAPKAATTGAAMPGFAIDVLELKIGRVIYKDYSQGTPPKVQSFNVNINERYENITNPYTFASLIIFKALMKTSIARLANFDLGPLQQGLGETLGEASRIAQETAAKALQATQGMTTTLQGSTQGAQQAAQDVTDAAKEAAETLKGLFPFGESEE